MARNRYASSTVPVSFKKLGGGLNSTSGPLGLDDSESSDLQNIDFDKFGSLLKRSGYTVLNTGGVLGDQGDGLYWWEYRAGGARVRKAVIVSDSEVYTMDNLDGTWDASGGAVTITAGEQVAFESWNNKLYMTNDIDPPWYLSNALSKVAMTVPTNLTDAKCIVQFQNYLMLGNIQLSTTGRHDSRFYWSAIKDDTTWSSTAFIDVSVDDGQEITGMKVLGDRLIIYKTRSIYQAVFTGDRDIPFGVYKTNSPVGCIAPFSIQATENGHIFLSHDGIYFFDGNNAYKISDRITSTLKDLSFTNVRSMYQRNKNRYWLILKESTNGDIVIVWDAYNNSFSIYRGMEISACAVFLVNGIDERPYFADFDGYTYRADVGVDDYPLNVQTAIDAYYYTNWKNYDDIVDQKRIPHIYLYHVAEDTALSVSYSYDLEESDERTVLLNLGGSTSVYGTAEYGTDTYASTSGLVQRLDFTGRGRVIRIKFANATLSESFQIDGIGVLAGVESQA